MREGWLLLARPSLLNKQNTPVHLKCSNKEHFKDMKHLGNLLEMWVNEKCGQVQLTGMKGMNA